MPRSRLLAALILAVGTIAALARPTAASPLTEQDSVVLTGFDNTTGNPAFDDALDQSLVLALEQSPFLNVLSQRKIADALKAMGHRANERVTPDLGRDLCRRTGSKAVLGGVIAKKETLYRLELHAVACANGDTLSKETGEVASEGEVLKALSQACARLRTHLGESAASVRHFDVPVEAATASLEALKNYGVGMRVRQEKGDTPTVPYLKRAIELDPRFPLPYAELTAIYRNFRQPSAALQNASTAYRLRDRVSERERLKITGIYYLATGDLEKEIRNYERWETKYPRDFVPYNNLGNDYAAMGQLDKSLTEYEHALQLMPSLISYVNVVGIDVSLDRFDAAGAALDEAFANKLDGRYLRQNVYWLAFLRGDAAKMQQQLAWAAGKPGDEDALLSMQSDTEAYYGHSAKAQDFTRRAVNLAVRAGSKETAALWQVNAALREAEVGNAAAAKQEAAAALALSSGRDVRLIAAYTLARAGESRHALTLLEDLQREYPTDSLMRLYWSPTIQAAVDIDRGNPSRALKDLETAQPYELGGAGTFVNYLYPAYVRGQAYLQVRDPGAAAAEFQKLLNHPGIVANFLTGALAHYQLARAYAMAHEPVKAAAAYQAFFALWKDADPEVPILKQARAEATTGT
jgi:tetratricopeptide (TPR) repeat protein